MTSPNASTPMTARDVAARLGITVDTFYRRRRKLEAADRMPAPIASTGRPTWERTGMMLWLNRHSPLAPSLPANDVVQVDPATLEDHQRELHAYYASFNR